MRAYLALKSGIIEKILLVASSVAVTVLFFGKSYYSATIDLAWHYGLAQYIADNWAIPSGHTYLSYMGYYPPGSHILAAVVGSVLGSTMTGLTATSLGAVVGIYVLLLNAMRFESNCKTVLALAIFCCAAFVVGGHGVLFGGEIVGNFFFAQVVGVLFSFGAFYVVSGLRTSIAQALSAIFLVYLLGWIFPLAQIYLATSCFCFIALSGLREVMLRKRLQRQKITAIVLLTGGLPVSIAYHPVFVMMSSAAQNDSGYFGSLAAGPLVVCAVSLLLVAVVLFSLHLCGRLQMLHPIRFIAFGMAVALSGMLQWIVWTYFGRGSEYAIAKHGFGVVTLLCASIAALVASLATLPTSAKWLNVRSIFVLVSVTSVCLMFAVLPVGRSLETLIDTSTFARSASAQMRHGPSAPSAVFDLRLTPVEQFAVAYGNLKLHANAAVALYLSNASGIPERYWNENVAYLKANPLKYAVIWSDAEPIANDACVLQRNPQLSLLLIDYACHEAVGYSLGTWLHVTRLMIPKLFLEAGWSPVEGWGVWSDGPESTLRFDVTEAESASDLVLEMHAASYLPTGHFQQRVEVSTSSKILLGGWTMKKAEPQKYEIRIPRHVINGNQLQLLLSFPDAISVGPHRSLALGIVDLRLRHIDQ